MKSNICKIENEDSNLQCILDEVAKCTAYNNLDVKQSRHIRLLAEELIGMIPELVKVGEGKFWLENDGKSYELHVSVDAINFGADDREKVLEISTSGKNAALKGISGKIRAAFDLLLYPSADAVATNYAFYNMGMHNVDGYVAAWSLDAYSVNVQADTGKHVEEWDELEKSIIAKLADDVVVGIVGRTVEIVVKKKV